mmetsp:Transcript_17107/g.16987  ORF Transcript_17107/g.16987 Transcript_17107/m.16987 type:complete len:314 (+) Transcript_17107:61-1002(+)
MLSAEEINVYHFDEDANDRLLDQHPWTSDEHYFTKVRISAVALIKMVMHAVSGGNIEVMGLMQGKVIGREFIVLDAFGLPVEGTETRVNAGASANEYMVNHVTMGESVGKTEGTCGWYHSHPGYGCWLSGIDVNTQKLHQQAEDPYLAIVIDPIRTISSGKVEIGCFRTFPDNYHPPEAEESEYQHIPLNKIEDFGVHYKHYYTLEHTIFKSSMDTNILDLLWNKYWTQTLSSSTLLKNKDYANSAIADLSEKLERFERQGRGGRGTWSMHGGEKNQLSKIAQDAAKIGSQQGQGLINMLLKNLLFYQPRVKE